MAVLFSVSVIASLWGISLSGYPLPEVEAATDETDIVKPAAGYSSLEIDAVTDETDPAAPAWEFPR